MEAYHKQVTSESTFNVSYINSWLRIVNFIRTKYFLT